jgi:hypothetical protein
VTTKRVAQRNTSSCSSSPPDLKQLENEPQRLSFQFSSSSRQLRAHMMSLNFPSAAQRVVGRFSDNSSACELIAAITSWLDENVKSVLGSEPESLSPESDI